MLLPAVLTCGVCAACREGRENICEHNQMFGNHVDGGFAEFVVAPAKDVYRLPPEIPLEAGSIIADAITTPFHAVVRRGQVVPGDWVLVLGCGGVGLNVVQIAAAIGARVIAVDMAADKLDWARRLGAEVVLDAAQVRAARQGGAPAHRRRRRRRRLRGDRQRRRPRSRRSTACRPAAGWCWSATARSR